MSNISAILLTVPSSPPCPGPACWCTAPSRGVSASWLHAGSGTEQYTPLQEHQWNDTSTRQFTIYSYQYHRCLTDGVRLSGQLDAAVLQLLHSLLQVHLFLHEGGESLLQLVHGRLQGLVNLHRYAPFCRVHKVTLLLCSAHLVSPPSRPPYLCAPGCARGCARSERGCSGGECGRAPRALRCDCGAAAPGSAPPPSGAWLLCGAAAPPPVSFWPRLSRPPAGPKLLEWTPPEGSSGMQLGPNNPNNRDNSVLTCQIIKWDLIFTDTSCVSMTNKNLNMAIITGHLNT